jgi:hypothetical protein
MIIKAMAITRCPYCHAIIDENDKYCNNCGTQLLFSDDEEVEEEIPGEKIIDANVEEKDYTVVEPEDEKRPKAAKDLDSEIDEELDKELREETEEMALDELAAEETREEAGEGLTEEVILVDEIEAARTEGPDGSKALDKGEPAAVKKLAADVGGEDEEEDDSEEHAEEEGDETGEDEEEELADELEVDAEKEREDEAGAGTDVKPGKKEETREYEAAPARRDDAAQKVPDEPAGSTEEPDVEYVSESAAPEEAATAGEASLRPVTFDTQELENLGRTVDLSKEKVDKFLEVMGEKKAVTPPPPAPTPEESAVPPTGSLPPWASTMKGAPVFPEDTSPVETRKVRGGEPAAPEPGDEEVEIFPYRRASDSTMGLPEKVSQAPLPFERTAAEADEAEEAAEEAEAEVLKVRDLTPEKVVLPAGQVRQVREAGPTDREPGSGAPPRREIEAAEDVEELAPRPPFSLSVFFKSKAFDVLFVGLFWLVALWLAASSMGQTLFEILGSMSGPMLLLYAVLVLLYFFLFKFFLGETLGDRLFRPRE